MKFKLEINFLINILLVVIYLPTIKSDCSIEYPNDINNVPKYEKYIGKFKIKIPYNGKLIKLYNDEKMQGFCNTYFSNIYYQIIEESYGNHRKTIVTNIISNQTSIVFKCIDNKLLINDIPNITQKVFSCVPKTWTIYSTKKPYSWCENNQNSNTLLLSLNSIKTNYVLAAICYNMEQISLQTIVYNTSTVQRNHLDMPQDIYKTNMIQNEDLDEIFGDLKTTAISDLSEELLQKTLTNLRNTDEWLNLANYEVSLIVQNEYLKKYLNDFKNILNIIWWRNLRLGNWKRFLNTLENYTTNNSYELYTGTSGVAQYPTNDKCVKEKLLEMKIGFKNEIVPAYIWTYLKSYDNLNKDFIIVGYNSPYAEYFTIDKVKFCPDICSEIPWLKEIYPSFSHAYAGIMFCCSTDFIRQTNYLQGFPMEILLRQSKQSPFVETTISESSTIV